MIDFHSCCINIVPSIDYSNETSTSFPLDVKWHITWLLPKGKSFWTVDQSINFRLLYSGRLEHCLEVSNMKQMLGQYPRLIADT